MAARGGATEAISCLLSFETNIRLYDSNGWLPVHNAAAFNQVVNLKMFLRRDLDGLLEAKSIAPVTVNSSSSVVRFEQPNATSSESMTPLLLASFYGALDVVRFLFLLGADSLAVDSLNRDLVHLAALRGHVHVLRWLLSRDEADILRVWKCLLKMIACLKQESEQDVEAAKCALQCVDAISSKEPEASWRPICKVMK